MAKRSLGQGRAGRSHTASRMRVETRAVDMAALDMDTWLEGNTLSSKVIVRNSANERAIHQQYLVIVAWGSVALLYTNTVLDGDGAGGATGLDNRSKTTNPRYMVS